MTSGYLPPREVAEQVMENCKVKAYLPGMPLVVLGILAGAYIAFGAELCTSVTHDLVPHAGLGFSRFVGGSVFSVGLMLVVLGGGELFTGNCLLLTGVIARRITTAPMLRNWLIVFLANFVGALMVVAIMYWGGLWKMGDMGMGAAALKTACAKVELSFAEAFLRGVACNWLVCLGVWLAVAGRDAASKILGIYFPVMAFVASSFEHSVANMYFIPMGLLLKGHASVVAASGMGDRIADLTWGSFLMGNLIPVTLGNIAGGALLVGGAYYFAYLHGAKSILPSDRVP